MSVDLIATILDAHHVSVDHFRRRGGYAWSCSCLTDGETVHRDWVDAHAAGTRHQAERVAAALEFAAATGSDPKTGSAAADRRAYSTVGEVS